VRDATAVVCVTDAAVRSSAGAIRNCGRQVPLRPERLRYTRAGCLSIPAFASRERLAPDDPDLHRHGLRSTDHAVVEAVLALPAEVRQRLRLRFIGHIETAAYGDAGAVGRADRADRLPAAGAGARVYRRDRLLLLITHDRSTWRRSSTTTLVGRPILAAVHPTGDVQRILDRTRAGWTADIGDPAAIGRMLAEAVARTPALEREFAPDAEAIAAYHRRPLAARYAELLRTLVEAAR